MLVPSALQLYHDVGENQPGPAGAQAPALGTYGRIVSPSASGGPSPAPGLAIVERFRLQSAARRLLPLEGVSTCLRCRQAGRDTVEVWHLPETASARFGGLQTCSSVWACPVCAAKISERRRVEVRAAIDAWNAKGPGHEVVLTTLTIRHKAGDRLGWLLNGLKGALKKTRQGKQGVKFATDFNVAGSITGTESTWSEANAHHPHLHQLLFVSPGCQFDLLLLHYRKQWDSALRLSGMRDVTSAGVKMTWANADIADYVTKIGGWDIEHELTKSPVKKGRSEGSFSPLQLLASFSNWLIAGTGDIDDAGYKHGQVWREYAYAMKGRHQLQWSRGLRKMLGLTPEQSDQEVNEQETDKLGRLLANLDKKEWALVLHFDARADLLRVAGSGDVREVSALLFDLELRFADDPKAERRFNTSRRENLTEWQDQKEAAAAELGLSATEYRVWLHGGIEALASPAPVDVPVQLLPASDGPVKGNYRTLQAYTRRVERAGLDLITFESAGGPLRWGSAPAYCLPETLEYVEPSEKPDPADEPRNGFSQRFAGVS